jgi:broad specificity phosphatase PhoE
VTRIFLIRHGQSEGNAGGIVQGRLDFGLTEYGRMQAERVACRLESEGVQRLVSSPLKRSWQTAEIMASRLGLEIEPEPDIQEYDVGAISGLTAAEIRERFPEVISAWQKGVRPAFPGAESREDFHDRVQAALSRLIAHGETVAAVAHGGVVSAICYYVLGIDPGRRGVFETANCAVTELSLDRRGHLVLVRVNDTCHLDGIVTTEDRG